MDMHKLNLAADLRILRAEFQNAIQPALVKIAEDLKAQHEAKKAKNEAPARLVSAYADIQALAVDGLQRLAIED
jgi:hypothetical protein